MGIASILKFFKFLYIIFWSVSSLLSSNNFEFQMGYNIPDNGVLTLKEGTYLNFTFNITYNLTRPGLLIQINSLKNGKITVTNCLLLMDCSETIYNKTCRCLFPGGPFQFTKTVHRTDDKAIYMWLAEDEKFNKFAQRNVTFNVTYPPRVTELLVDNKDGVRVHLVLPNESFTVICRWENGNPPTLPRLLDSEGTHLKITKENGTHAKGQHSFLRCHVIERIRCEVDGSDRNMSATVMAKFRRRSVTSPYQTTTPPRTESDKSSSKTSSYNEVDDLELTARIREEADSVEYTRPSPPTAHAHSTRTALSSHAERLIAVPQEAVTIEQAARAQQPEYVEIENEVRPNGDDGYLVPAGQYASLNPATRSEEGHEYENLGSRPTESSSTPGYSGLVKSTKREKHLYDRLRRETNQTIEAEEEDPTYAIALEQMPGPTFTKL